MDSYKKNTTRGLMIAFFFSLFFAACSEDDDFSDQAFNSNDFRILKVTELSASPERVLSDGAIGVSAEGLQLEVVFSTEVNQSALESALSISNSITYTPTYDDTGSILTLDVADLDYETEYTVTLPAGDYGANGESLSSDYSLSFTTSPFITPDVSLGVSANSVGEGETVSLIASLSESTTEDVTVNLTYSGSATLDSDFTAAASITIPEGETSASIDLTAIDDTDVEGEEIITAAIDNITNGNEDGDQEVAITIVDNDVATGLMLKGIMALTWTTSGTNGGKAIHLKATADIADLSVYSIGVANNGGGTDGIEYTFPVMSVSAGDDILLAREDATLTGYFGGCASDFEHVIQSDAMNQNGDDAIELFSGETLIETYGDVDVDGTGEEWEYAGSWAYKLGDTWIYGGVDCAASSTTTQDSNCTYPLCLPPLQLQGVLSLELESRDRAIHLRANADIADLSVYGIGIPNNGGPSDGREMDFASISVSEGDHILFVRGEDETTLLNYLGACTNNFDHIITDTGADINFNGDDPVELYENTTVIEYYGTIDAATGEYEDGTGLSWEYTGSWAFKQFGDQYIYGGVGCTAAGTTNATSACPYAFCE
ncbi:MAG: hypothetical protein Tsb0034_10090 [Ekhidna sp.]